MLYIFQMLSTDAKIDTTFDSVTFLRYRVNGAVPPVFVDRILAAVGDTFPDDNYSRGAAIKGIRASDGSGTLGQYIVRAKGWKGTTVAQHGVASYLVVDSSGSVPSINPRMPQFAGNTQAWNQVAVTGMPMPTYTQPTGFLTTTFPAGTIMAKVDTSVIRANIVDEKIDVNAGGAVTLVRETQRVDTLVFILPAEKSLLADTIDNHPFTTTAADKQGIASNVADSLAGLGRREVNLLEDPGFESRPLGTSEPWKQTVATAAIVSGDNLYAGRKMLKLSGASAQVTSDSFYLSAGDRISFGGAVNATFTSTPAISIRRGATVVASVPTLSTTNVWLDLKSTPDIMIGTGGTHRLVLSNGALAADSAKFDEVFVIVMPDSIGGSVIATSTGPDSATISRLIKRLVWGLNPGNGSDSTPVASRTVAAHGTSGAGAFLCSLLVTDSAAGTPVQGVLVWITTSGAFTAGSENSNSAGNVVLNLDNGTHAAHIFSSGVRLATNADTIVNISGVNFKDTITTVSTAPGTTPAVGRTTVFGDIRTITGDTLIVGVEIWAEPVKTGVRCCDSDTTAATFVLPRQIPAIFKSGGRWEIDLYPSTSLNPDTDYRFYIKWGGTTFVKTVTVPATSPWRLQWAW